MIFLHSSLHSTHILNLHLFSANLVKKIDMSYHAAFFSITYTMTLTPFDSFKVKWLNSHIFYELCGCRDDRYASRKAWIWMTIRGKRKQLSTKFEHQDNHIFMKYDK